MKNQKELNELVRTSVDANTEIKLTPRRSAYGSENLIITIICDDKVLFRSDDETGEVENNLAPVEVEAGNESADEFCWNDLCRAAAAYAKAVSITAAFGRGEIDRCPCGRGLATEEIQNGWDDKTNRGVYEKVCEACFDEHHASQPGVCAHNPSYNCYFNGICTFNPDDNGLEWNGRCAYQDAPVFLGNNN